MPLASTPRDIKWHKLSWLFDFPPRLSESPTGPLYCHLIHCLIFVQKFFHHSWACLGLCQSSQFLHEAQKRKGTESGSGRCKILGYQIDGQWKFGWLRMTLAILRLRQRLKRKKFRLSDRSFRLTGDCINMLGRKSNGKGFSSSSPLYQIM